jgi:hypothetical protein
MQAAGEQHLTPHAPPLPHHPQLRGRMPCAGRTTCGCAAVCGGTTCDPHPVQLMWPASPLAEEKTRLLGVLKQGMVAFDVSIRSGAHIVGPKTNPRANILVGLTERGAVEPSSVQVLSIHKRLLSVLHSYLL